MSMSLGSQGKISAEINVTPMIDVLLVLIIIFLVVLPHHWVGEKVEIPQPSKETVRADPEKQIVIQLHDSGESQRPLLRINQEEVKWEDWETRLKDIYTQRMGKVPFLHCDPEVDFEYVPHVVAFTHHARLPRQGFMAV